MAHCTKCGTEIASNAQFCPNCGAAQPAASQVAGAAQQGLAENVAGLLCYVLGWITGLIFFLIDKRPFVRFHAAQSMVVFGALHVLSIVLGWVFGISMLMGGMAGFSVGMLLAMLVNLAALVLWIVCMVKAYQGERFRVPLAADLADGIAR
jgi:uncharacterized membrane protein